MGKELIEDLDGAPLCRCKAWRLLHTIARLFDLETVDDDGISHGTAREDLPCGSFYMMHELVEGVIAGEIVSKADVNYRLLFFPILYF